MAEASPSPQQKKCQVTAQSPVYGTYVTPKVSCNLNPFAAYALTDLGYKPSTMSKSKHNTNNDTICGNTARKGISFAFAPEVFNNLHNKKEGDASLAMKQEGIALGSTKEGVASCTTRVILSD